MKQIICNLILIIGIISFHSCLKEEENIFGQSSAERLIEAAKEYEEILSSAENGWVMDFFAEYEENKMGGYQILCKFDKGKVTMAGAFTLSSKYTEMGKKISSSYSFVNSQGPVLSFDGYNDVLHGFADPGSQSNTDGYAGDIEFIIIKATKEEVVMRGIKRNLKIVLRPMEAGKDWDEYCLEVEAMQKNLADISRFAVNKDGQKIGYFTFRSEENEVHNTETPEIGITKYTVTNKGINLYDSLTIGNTVFKRFTWDQQNTKFTDFNAKDNYEITPVYISVDNLIGTYMVTADNQDEPVSVTFSKGAKDNIIKVSKELIGYEFDIEVYGDNNKLAIKTQTVGRDENGNYIKLAVATVTDLIITTTTTTYTNRYGYSGSWYRGTVDNPELRFLRSAHPLLFMTTYVIGIRVVVYSDDTLNKDHIVEYKDMLIANPIFIRK